jgi:hypothetical protein
MLDDFVRVGKSVRNREMLGRFVGGFLAARADRLDLFTFSGCFERLQNVRLINIFCDCVSRMHIS